MTLIHSFGSVMIMAVMSISISGCGDSSRSNTPGGTVPTRGGATPGQSDSHPARQDVTTKRAAQDLQKPAGAGDGSEATMEHAMFGAGCFWGVEHIFRKQVPGVIDAVSGYAGGTLENPTYEQVCRHDTGHAEVVQVTFDPSKVTYEQLVDYFFRLHDPTQVDGQGPDLGDQYRSVIFYYTPEQKATAEAVKKRRAPKYSRPIATTIEPASTFYKAEGYHQRYYERTGKTPYCHVLRPD